MTNSTISCRWSATSRCLMRHRGGAEACGFLCSAFGAQRRIHRGAGGGQVEVSRALERVGHEGVSRVELDLRGNLGGLVSQGVETARLFLDGAARLPLRGPSASAFISTAVKRHCHT